MIKEEIKGNVFESDCDHIVFAVNVEGLNDSGFAGAVTKEIWPELRYRKDCKLGDVYTHLECDDGTNEEPRDKTFHAVVCHSLSTAQGGWSSAPDIILKALNELPIKQHRERDFSKGRVYETVAIVKIGDDPVGKVMGADVVAIMGAVDRSSTDVTVYSL